MDINNVTLVGRLCSDPKLSYTQSGKAVAKFSLAVGRMKKEETDFINCIAWEKTAEVIGEYCRKGSKVGIVGKIQTGSYENEEKKKVYTFDVLVREIQFLDTKEKTGEVEEKIGEVEEKIKEVDDFTDDFNF